MLDEHFTRLAAAQQQGLLGGGDDGFAHLVASGDDVLLHERNLFCWNLNREITACDHDAVKGCNNFFQIIYRLWRTPHKANRQQEELSNIISGAILDGQNQIHDLYKENATAEEVEARMRRSFVYWKNKLDTTLTTYGNARELQGVEKERIEKIEVLNGGAKIIIDKKRLLHGVHKRRNPDLYEYIIS